MTDQPIDYDALVKQFMALAKTDPDPRPRINGPNDIDGRELYKHWLNRTILRKRAEVLQRLGRVLESEKRKKKLTDERMAELYCWEEKIETEHYEIIYSAYLYQRLPDGTLHTIESGKAFI